MKTKLLGVSWIVTGTQISRANKTQRFPAWTNYLPLPPFDIDSGIIAQLLSPLQSDHKKLCMEEGGENTVTFVIPKIDPRDPSSYSKAHLERIHLS